MVEVNDGLTRDEVPDRDRILITEAVAQQILSDSQFNVRYLGLFELRNITGMHKIYECVTEFASN